MKCTGCGCTEEHACEGGCSWISTDPPVCSRCAEQATPVFRETLGGSLIDARAWRRFGRRRPRCRSTPNVASRSQEQRRCLVKSLPRSELRRNAFTADQRQRRAQGCLRQVPPDCHPGAERVSVYVDDMRARFGRMVMCHMIADTSAELHAMARRIGVAKRWVQNARTYREHYDICLSKRERAVRLGAIEITWSDLGEKLQERKTA